MSGQGFTAEEVETLGNKVGSRAKMETAVVSGVGLKITIMAQVFTGVQFMVGMWVTGRLPAMLTGW